MSSSILPNDTALSETRGQVGWIRLNRPKTMNALNPAMIDAIHAALDQFDASGDIRAIVITGTGRAFCAGADLKDARANGEAENGDAASERFLDSVQNMMLRLERSKIPVLSLLNGITMGAGFEIALCCDIILAARSARIGDGHAKFGLLPGGGSSARLPKRVGIPAAKAFMFTADLFVAEEAARLGMVEFVFDDEQAEAQAQSIGERIASRSPLAIQRMKELITKAVDVPLDVALEEERKMMRLHRHSADRAEGLAAFAEKRAPKFTGNSTTLDMKSRGP